ncbi:4-hydroxy-tetrahydrodipicolinate synthase [Aquicella lusitana]|uniref:4-hydroxy-tetrahydrodipicolinate synthase n=1 Tax=Aquicella lusitana TaxID=254246 RepID=A0A370GM49_9COXI|nr:4-hydroxy-tetrahydrodipicolinate synthase [Aquicella lusitana]RDI44812.1 dihydrodipicolinate synthase [Aquicella lusitana]VVC73009.1 4-hydroxy-tetrahydrodipicolinate synthase [Aquicella lusitana]
MFKGSMVALVTPMHDDGSIDKKALEDLVEWHIESKTDAIIVAGTTGESATLNHDEQSDLIARVVKQVAKRIPVIAGTGTNATQTTLTLSENAKRAGADACLIVTPYYNKPTQNGLYQHYKTIAEKIALPVILYNVPGRTSCDMLPETVERLSKIKNIIGIKEATGKVERTKEILSRCDKTFAVYSGDDATALDLMQQGARGVISVTANIAPLKMHEMCQAALNGNRMLAEKINAELMLLHTRLFLESNPIPAKWALHAMGKISLGIRLPLLPLDSKYHHEVKEAMQNAGVK